MGINIELRAIEFEIQLKVFSTKKETVTGIG